MSSQSESPSSSSRDRLLQSAKRLFARQGYEQTATSAIARQAHTSESQLMRYFGGKAGLLDALFVGEWEQLNHRVREAVDAAERHRDKLLAMLHTISAAFASDPDLATLFLFEGRRLRGDQPRVRVSAGFVAFADHARAIVRRGQAKGEFDRALDAAALTSALLGAAESMIRDRVLARAAGRRAFAEREVQRTLEAMLAGFEGGTKSTRPGSRRARRVGRAPIKTAAR